MIKINFLINSLIWILDTIIQVAYFIVHLIGQISVMDICREAGAKSNCQFILHKRQLWHIKVCLKRRPYHAIGICCWNGNTHPVDDTQEESTPISTNQVAHNTAV